MGDRTGVRASWPAAAVCRVVPVALVAVGVFVPALRWSTLPSDKPGAFLLLAIGWTAIGIAALARQMWMPRGWAAEHYDSRFTGFGLVGLVVVPLSWLRSQFGPTATGLFALAWATGISVATSIASSHSRTWRLSLLAFIVSCVAALVLGALGGFVVRHFGRLVGHTGRSVPRSAATARR